MSAKVGIPMGIFNFPAEKKNSRGNFKNSHGKIFLYNGREINSMGKIKKTKMLFFLQRNHPLSKCYE